MKSCILFVCCECERVSTTYGNSDLIDEGINRDSVPLERTASYKKMFEVGINFLADEQGALVVNSLKPEGKRYLYDSKLYFSHLVSCGRCREFLH